MIESNSIGANNATPQGGKCATPLFHNKTTSSSTEQEILEKIDDLAEKVSAVYESAEKTRKYFKWTLILTLIFFVLPLVAILAILPSLMSGITDLYGSI